MLFSQKFRDNESKYKLVALRTGLRVRPYERADVLAMVDEDIVRIRESINSMSLDWDMKEYAYFVSSPVVKTAIDSKKLIEFTSYKEMILAGKIDRYLQFHENKKNLYGVPDDYDTYLENETLYNWCQAVRLEKEDEYFQGIGIFPEKIVSKRVKYSGDYDEYIKSLTDVQLFQLYSKYRQPLSVRHQTYERATTFVQTMTEQIEKYILVLRDMEEPIYIPGDGIGTGSYVCRMLKKRYISCEMNSIGYESYLVGLITHFGVFRLEDAETCASVFLGNVVNYLSEDEMASISHKKICIWDEQPKNIDGWVNGGDVRLWYNYSIIPVLPEMKFKYPVILSNLSNKYNLVPEDNICKAIMIKYKISPNARKKLLITSHPVVGKPSYCVFTRSFSYDVKHGRKGQMKDLCGEMIEWRPDPMILDGYFGKVALAEYEKNVLSSFEFNGDIIEAKVKYPARYKYVRMGSENVKVVHVGNNLVTGKSQYRFNSDYKFTKEYKD